MSFALRIGADTGQEFNALWRISVKPARTPKLINDIKKEKAKITMYLRSI
jgi:hypothetical protein